MVFGCVCCLVCGEGMSERLGWGDLFLPSREEFVCAECMGRLERVTGEVCRICGRPFSTLPAQFRNVDDQCYDCVRWESDATFQGSLTENISIYIYNDFLKDIISRFKYRGDYILAKIFAQELKRQISQINPDYIIPIPLSEERLFERGFNQAEALIVEAGFPVTTNLTRIHTEKQSKKSRTERIHLTEIFEATQPIKGKLLLVDDIYTTGSTLRHAAKELKSAGADSIQSITIARG